MSMKIIDNDDNNKEQYGKNKKKIKLLLNAKKDFVMTIDDRQYTVIRKKPLPDIATDIGLILEKKIQQEQSQSQSLLLPLYKKVINYVKKHIYHTKTR